MNIILALYDRIRNWLFPPADANSQLCTHCETVSLPPPVYATIRYNGGHIGYANTIHLANRSWHLPDSKRAYVLELIFHLDGLERIFMNGVAVASSQRDGFEIWWNDGSKKATGVYLIDSNPPILGHSDGGEVVRLTSAMVEYDDLQEGAPANPA
jgi:hypothetical protein